MRGSVISAVWPITNAPSVNTWISARGSVPTSARAVRSASGSRCGRSRGRAARMHESARSRSRPRAAVTCGCTPASITMISAPSPSRRTTAAASDRAASNREGETSRAFIDAEVSRTTTTLRALHPVTVTTGRASARASASSASSCKVRSRPRSRCWKHVDASREARDPLPVATQRLTVHGDVARLARLRVVQPEIAAEIGVQLARVEDVDDVHVEAPLEQRAHAGLEPLRVEQVGDDHGEAGLARAHRVLAEGLVEPGRPARVDVREEVEQRDHLVAPARGRPALHRALAQDADAHALVAHEPDEAERPRHAHRVLEL